MISCLKNRQTLLFQQLINDEIPNLLKNSSARVGGDYTVDFEVVPFDVSDVIEENGTVFGIVKTQCSVLSEKTGERVSFILDLLNLPILQNLGFKINGNYMQVLDSYNRASGWSFFRKEKNGDKMVGATLLPVGDFVKSLDFTYSKDNFSVSKRNKEAGDDFAKVDLCTFLRAITGMNEQELVQFFGFNNPYVKTCFDTNRKLQKGVLAANRNDCIYSTAYAFLGSKRVKPSSVTTDLLCSLKKYLFNKHYFNLGSSNRKRLTDLQSFSNRALGKYLAQDLEIDGVLYEAGITLTGPVLTKIDNSLVDTLDVEFHNKIYTLRKFSIYTFRVLGLEAAETFSVGEVVFEKGHKFSFDDLRVLNESDRNSLLVRTSSGEEITVTRRVDGSYLQIEDLYTAISILFDNINGFDTYDSEYELTNRVVEPFTKRVLGILQNHLSIITEKLDSLLSTKSDSEVALPIYLENFNVIGEKRGYNLFDLNAFISFVSGSDSITGQMSDNTNIMAFLEKSNKITSNIKSQSITGDLVSVQNFQNGRLDPIDSPESSKIGIVHYKTILTQEDDDGNLVVPFYRVENGEVIGNEPVYLTATEEKDLYVAEWCETFKNEDGTKKQRVLARHHGDVISVDVKLVTVKEYSQLSSMSPARSCIPFQNHANGKRLLMSCNHQKQAVPTIGSTRPRTATGCESLLDTGAYRVSTVLQDFYDSRVIAVPELKFYKEQILGSDLLLVSIDVQRDCKIVKLKIVEMESVVDKFGNSLCEDFITLNIPFAIKNSEKGLFSYRVNVVPSNLYHSNDVIAYSLGYSLDKKKTEIFGDYGGLQVDDATFDSGLALGMDLTVAFKTYESSTIDDAITVSSDIVMDDTLTSIFMVDIKKELKTTGDSYEYFGKLTEVSSKYPHIEYNGLPKIGSVLRAGDVVLTYIKQFNNGEIRQKEVIVSSYIDGQVIDAFVYTKHNKVIAKVIMATRATAEVGDKLSGRYGNKGVIAKIKPAEEMPYDPETGRSVQVLLNPLGIPSRMNISQLLELIVSEAMRKKDHYAVFTPFYDKDLETVKDLAKACDVKPKMLCDGRTGKMFKRPVNFGTLYMYKLVHMINKKAHSIGSKVKVDPVFRQPRHGQKNDGGQSFEEMCCWCVSSVGATKVLQDIYSIQSDDFQNRKSLSNSIKIDPENAVACGENRSDEVLQAYVRTMCVELRTIENGYEFLPLSDKMIRGLSSLPIEHEKSLHSNLIFRNTEMGESRTDWSWIDLKCEIVHPVWVYKGILHKILGPDVKSSDLGNLIKCTKFLYLTLEDSRVVDFKFVDPDEVEVFKDKEGAKGEESRSGKVFKTGFSGLTYLLKNIDLSKVLEKYEERYQKKKLKGSKIDESFLERFNVCKDFIETSGEEHPSLAQYVISAFPVMPPAFRPEMKGLNVNDVPDFDWHYKQILNAVREVVNKNNSDASVYHLYETIAVFIGFKKMKSLRYQTVLLWFYGQGSSNKNHGKIRDNVQKKRTVCSGRSVIIPMQDVHMKPTEIGIPISMAVKMWGDSIISYISRFTRIEDSFYGEKAQNLLNLLASNNANKFMEIYKENFLEVFGVPSENILLTFRTWIREFVEGDSAKGLHPQVVLAGRQPSLHKFSIRAFTVKIVDSKAIQIHPLSCKGYNADFDGDTMWVIALLTEEAKKEALEKMAPDRDFINPKNSSIILEHSQDVVLGCYCATMLKNNAESLEEALDGELHDLHDKVLYYSNTRQLKTDVESSIVEPFDLVCLKFEGRRYLSTAGRILFNSLIPGGFTDKPFSNVLGLPDLNYEIFDLRYDGLLMSGTGIGGMKSVNISTVCKDLYEEMGSSCVEVYQKILEFGFFYSDLFSVTLSLEDLDLQTKKKDFIKDADALKTKIEKDFQKGLISEEDKKQAVISLYKKANSKIKEDLVSSLPRNNNFFIIFDSGARGNASQLMQTSGAIGVLQKTATEDLETSITSNYTEGISSFDMHLTTFSSRIGVASTQNETSTAGYATRHAVYSAAGLEIVSYDCGKKNWYYTVEWASLLPELSTFSPTQDWFDKNLLGHQVADNKTGDFLGLRVGDVVGVDSFERVAGGFHYLSVRDANDKIFTYEVATRGKGLLTPIGRRLTDDFTEFKNLADKVNGQLIYNSKCSVVAEEKHVKTVTTAEGIFNFRYKMSALSRALLLNREARSLPFLKKHVTVFKNGKILEVHLVTEKTLDWITENGVDVVEVRLSLDCEARYGLCSRCYGLGFSDGELKDVGVNVGIEAAQAIGEPAAQLTMSLVNSGGVAGESVASGVEIVGAMLRGSLPGSMVNPIISMTEGYVNILRYGDSVGIRIDPANKECALCKKCRAKNGVTKCTFDKIQMPLCLVDSKQIATSLLVRDGQFVRAGDQLTFGFLNLKNENINARFMHPNLLTREHFNNLEELLRQKQITWLDCYFYTFKENNIFVNPRHFELFAYLQLSKITSREESENFRIGTRYSYSELRQIERETGDHLNDFVIRNSTINEVVADNSGLLTALSFEDVSKSLAEFTNKKMKVDVRHNNAIIGGLNVGVDLQSLKSKPKMLQKIPYYLSKVKEIPKKSFFSSYQIEKKSDSVSSALSLSDDDLFSLADLETEETLMVADSSVSDSKTLDTMSLFGDLGIGEIHTTSEGDQSSQGVDSETQGVGSETQGVDSETQGVDSDFLTSMFLFNS